MSEVFISYSSEDVELCRDLIGYLKFYKVAIWQDKMDLKPARKWNTAIISAIEDCKILIVLLTKNALQSAEVRKEVKKAINDKKSILCIKLENVKVEDKDIIFSTLSRDHWIEVKDKKNILAEIQPILNCLIDHDVNMSSDVIELGNEYYNAQPKKKDERSIWKKWKTQLATVAVLIIATVSYLNWPTPECCTRTDQSLKKLYIKWAISKELDPWVLSSFDSLLRLDHVRKPVNKMQLWLDEAKISAAEATEVAPQRFDYLDVLIDIPFDKLDMEKSFFRLWKRSRDQSENLERVQAALIEFSGEKHQKVLFETWRQQI